MTLLSTLYLEVFVLITCFGLWHKNVSGKAAKTVFTHVPVYRALYIVTIFVSPRVVFFFVLYHSTILSSKASATMDNFGTIFYLPLSFIYFLFKGWYSIRREKKRMMVVFLGICFVITVGWAVLFYSDVYRWSAFLASGRDFCLNLFVLQEFCTMAIPSLLHSRILYSPDCITGLRHHLSHELWQRISPIL